MFRSIAQSIRRRAGRKSIEPKFSTTLTVRNKELQEYFESKSVMMMEKSKSSDEKGSKATYIFSNPGIFKNLVLTSLKLP